MRPAVTYTQYGTSSIEKKWRYKLAQFEERNILTKTCNDAEISEESDNESIIMSEQDIDAINSSDESDHDFISTKMLEDIRDGNQTHPNVNILEARYKICDRIRQRQLEWKGALKAARSIGKGLHKVFLTVVKEILQDLPPLGESGS